MQPYVLIQDLARETPEIPGDSILSRTYFEDDQMKAILFAFAPGQELSEHTASHPAILHFLRGEADLTDLASMLVEFRTLAGSSVTASRAISIERTIETVVGNYLADLLEKQSEHEAG